MSYTVFLRSRIKLKGNCDLLASQATNAEEVAAYEERRKRRKVKGALCLVWVGVGVGLARSDERLAFAGVL